MKIRSVENVIPAVATYEGAGFLVHRPFPSSSLDHLDPFLELEQQDQRLPEDIVVFDEQDADRLVAGLHARHHTAYSAERSSG